MSDGCGSPIGGEFIRRGVVRGPSEAAEGGQRRRIGRRAHLVGFLVTALVAAGCAAAPPAPQWIYAPAAAAPVAASIAPPPAFAPDAPAFAPDAPGFSPDLTDPEDDSAANPGNDGDEGVDPTAVWLAPNDGRIQVYPDRPSVLPGQALRLHASTAARSYSLTVTREGSPERVVFRRSGYVGHDYRKLVRTDNTTMTTRAGWPVGASISTKGWRTGVYTILARDSSGRTSGAIFVVRDASPSRANALFVLPVLDYQAYNGWGGPNFYNANLADRATIVSWDRPYNANGGLSYYPTYDRYIVRWLEGHGYPLTYTTDYDLALAPPTSAPLVLVIPQHAEYVPATLYDWVDQHVNVAGDMNVASFGANSFYWQTRLVPDPRGGGRTPEQLSYKSTWRDPITAIDSSLVTCRWRDAPVNRPESALFGGMYSGIVDGGHVRLDMTVAQTTPSWALAGTGWTAGTVIRGILTGEADQADPAMGGVVALSAQADYHHSDGSTTVLTANSTFRTSEPGARVFDAGTFGWGAALGGRWGLGVSKASFDLFNRNIMAWLGLAATK